MNGDVDRHEVLTAADVPGFPNGTATVYRVQAFDGEYTRLATLDARGILRSLDDQRAVFIREDGFDLEVVE